MLGNSLRMDSPCQNITSKKVDFTTMEENCCLFNVLKLHWWLYTRLSLRFQPSPCPASERGHHWAITEAAGSEVQLWQDNLPQVCIQNQHTQILARLNSFSERWGNNSKDVLSGLLKTDSTWFHLFAGCMGKVRRSKTFSCSLCTWGLIWGKNALLASLNNYWVAD